MDCVLFFNFKKHLRLIKINNNEKLKRSFPTEDTLEQLIKSAINLTDTSAQQKIEAIVSFKQSVLRN